MINQAFSIRAYHSSDLEDVYRICLATGNAGEDASGFYRDPKLLGHLYAAPYAALTPQSVFVAEDAQGVAGYVVGAVDTIEFEQTLETEWWPDLRAAYPAPPTSFDEASVGDARIRAAIHRPPRTPRRIATAFPSHLHINLLPRLQGKGIGRLLIDRWLRTVHEAGSTGAHLAVGAANARAVRFYAAYGFRELERTGPPFNVIWFGFALRDRR